jgi:hypothetical protein
MQRAMMGSSVVRASHARLDIGARDGCTVMGVVTLTRTCEAYMQCESCGMSVCCVECSGEAMCVGELAMSPVW